MLGRWADTLCREATRLKDFEHLEATEAWSSGVQSVPESGAGLPEAEHFRPARARAASSLSQGEWSPLPVVPIGTLRFIRVGAYLFLPQ